MATSQESVILYFSIKNGVKPGKCLYRPGFTLKRVDKNL